MKIPTFGLEPGRAIWCRDHAQEGAADVKSRVCEITGCRKWPGFGMVEGEARWCRLHAQEGAFDTKHPRCLVDDCRKVAVLARRGGKATMCIHHGSLRGMRRPSEWVKLKKNPKSPARRRHTKKQQKSQSASTSALELLCQAAAGARDDQTANVFYERLKN